MPEAWQVHHVYLRAGRAVLRPDWRELCRDLAALNVVADDEQLRAGSLSGESVRFQQHGGEDQAGSGGRDPSRKSSTLAVTDQHAPADLLNRG
jgi:hypothetical protein